MDEIKKGQGIKLLNFFWINIQPIKKNRKNNLKIKKIEYIIIEKKKIKI
jgi:hypothetical protein